MNRPEDTLLMAVNHKISITATPPCSPPSGIGLSQAFLLRLVYRRICPHVESFESNKRDCLILAKTSKNDYKRLQNPVISTTKTLQKGLFGLQSD